MLDENPSLAHRAGVKVEVKCQIGVDHLNHRILTDFWSNWTYCPDLLLLNQGTFTSKRSKFSHFLCLTMSYILKKSHKRVWILKSMRKGVTRKGLEMDCAHLLVLKTGAPFSWTSSIVSVYGAATPYLTHLKWLNGQFAETIGAPLFNGNR